MKAINLTCEYMNEPIGIDLLHPHLFWNCNEGVKQTAYQLIATINNYVIWDTGKIYSSNMSHIEYQGQPLQSRDLVVWKVSLWDENDEQGEFVNSTFEIGLVEEKDWIAKWITSGVEVEEYQRFPADYFKKEFILDKKVKKARLYASARGIYTVTINNIKLEDFYLAPGTTDYRKRIQYQTYDITTYLKQYNNLEITLGDGWYRGSIGAFGEVEVFGRETSVITQLEIEYEDSSKFIIPSDSSFDWSSDGPIRFNDLKDGEIYDSRMNPTYHSKAKELEYPFVLYASNNVPVRKQEEFSPELIITPLGKRVLDFKQNIAGFIKFKVNANTNDVIQLRFGEILDEDGEFTQDNISVEKPIGRMSNDDQMYLLMKQKNKIKDPLQSTPLQEVHYICNGIKDEYESSLCIFGFRYVEITSTIEINVNDYKAVAVYSDLKQVGEFECSNNKINQFYKNTVWSMKGNFLDVPTDCPTRERLAWSGDGQIFFNTSTYLMNVAPIYRKWLNDFKDNQYEDGSSSAVIPFSGFEMLYKNTGKSVGWADAIVLIPYRFWKKYQDQRIIKDLYIEMKNYANFMIKSCGMSNESDASKNPYNEYTYEKGYHLGEWLEPEDIRVVEMEARVLRTEECTAYLYYTMQCMSEIAQELNFMEDYELYTRYAQGAKQAYNYLFVKDGLISTTTQAKYCRPLAFGLLCEEDQIKNKELLISNIVSRNYKIGTGFLTTSLLLPTLTTLGSSEIAYKMLENEEMPGWLYQVNKGATTVWENWNGKSSRNHYSPGAVCEWFFEGICGINVQENQHILIEPQIGGTLNYAKARYESIYGVIHSSWSIQSDKIVIEVELPSNTMGTIIINKERIEINAGINQLEIDVD